MEIEKINSGELRAIGYDARARLLKIDGGRLLWSIKNGSLHRRLPVQHTPVTGLDDQIGFGYGATKQRDAHISFLRGQGKFRCLAVIHRTLQHIALAQSARSIAATPRQLDAMLICSFEDGFASFGGEGVIVRL